MLDKNLVSIEHLCRASRGDLSDLFSRCDPLPPDELSGAMGGRVINGHILWATKWGLWLTNRIWKGKEFSFSGREGRNLVTLGFVNLSLFLFRTGREKSMAYPGEVLTLRYKHHSSYNPWPVRSIVDEMRKIREGLYLGTGNIKLLGSYRLFDWYILERPNAEKSARP